MVSIEEHIQKAMEQGKFDNLEGKGKPLHLEDNPWEDPAWSMAYHMLQNANIPLPWIATRKEIEADLQQAREGLQRTWQWKQAAPQTHPPDRFVEQVWQRAVSAFRDQVSEINRRIVSYNLDAPSAQFHMFQVDAERVLAQLTTQDLSDTLKP